MRRAYQLTLEDENGKEIEVSLRLTAGGETKLHEKYKDKGTFELLNLATSNIEIMCDVLTQCLKYKDNTNTIQKGSELYDLIVENGLGGTRNWQKIIAEIAYVSGKYDEEEKEAIIDNINTEVQKLIDGDIDETKNQPTVVS